MISNLRDLGGMPAADGRTIRKGLLIRSAKLLKATKKDLKGISSVIDLRTPKERNREKDRTYKTEYLPLPVFEELTAGISHAKGEKERSIPDMAVLYRHLVRNCADSFGRILTAIMEHDFSSGAVLWHCTEGKDRCGITTAIVLEMLGVDRDLIMEDYLKTNVINMPKAAVLRDRLIRPYGEEFANEVYQEYIADERYLKAAWDEMGDEYIQARLGIGRDAVLRFRDTVLDGNA